MKRFIASFLLLSFMLAVSVSVASTHYEKHDEGVPKKEVVKFTSIEFIHPYAVEFTAPKFEYFVPEKIGKVINKPASWFKEKDRICRWTKITHNNI